MTRAVPAATLRAPRPWWWVADPRLSLRAAAALYTGLAAAAFTLLLGWLASRSLQRSLEEQLGNSFGTLAAQLSDKLDRTLHERHRTLQLAAALAPLRAYDATVADRRRVLEAVQDATPDFAWIGLASAQGRIVAATGGVLEGSDAEARPWFRAAFEQPYAGGLREPRELPAALLKSDDGESAPRVLDFAVPVADPDGRFAGVLGAQVRWGWTREVLLSVVPDNARRDRLGATVYSGDGDVLLDSGGSGWTQPPDAPALPDARRLRGHFLESTHLGTVYFTAYARSRGFKEYRGLGWTVTVRQPAALAFAPVASLQRTVYGWGFALTLLGAATAWTLAARLSRRLHTVGLAAERIRHGDVLATLPSGTGEGEVERMCGALWRLVEELRPPPDRSPPPPDVRPPRRDLGPIV